MNDPQAGEEMKGGRLKPRDVWKSQADGLCSETCRGASRPASLSLHRCELLTDHVEAPGLGELSLSESPFEKAVYPGAGGRMEMPWAPLIPQELRTAGQGVGEHSAGIPPELWKERLSGSRVRNPTIAWSTVLGASLFQRKLD